MVRRPEVEELSSYCEGVMRDGVVDSAEAEQLHLWRDRVDSAEWERVLLSHGISPGAVMSSVEAAQPCLRYRLPARAIFAAEPWQLELSLEAGDGGRPGVVTAWVEAAGRVRVPRRQAAADGSPLQFPGLKSGTYVVNFEVEQVRGERTLVWTGWIAISVDERSGGTTIHVSGEGNTVAGGMLVRGTGNLVTQPTANGNADGGSQWRECVLKRQERRWRVVKQGQSSTPEAAHAPIAMSVRRTGDRFVRGRLLVGHELSVGRGLDCSINLQLFATPAVGDGPLHPALRDVSRMSLLFDATALASGLRLHVANQNGARVGGVDRARGSVEPIRLAADGAPVEIALAPAGRVRLDLRGIGRCAPLRDIDRRALGHEGKLSQDARRAKLGGVRLGITIDSRRIEFIWVFSTLPGEAVGFSNSTASVGIVSAGGSIWLVECPPREPASGDLRAWSIRPGAVIDLGGTHSFRVTPGLDFD